MSKRWIAVLLLVVTVAGLLPACGGSGGNTFKLGIQLPLTGEMAYTGTGEKKAFDLVIEEANKAGGILGKKIEVFYEDDKGDPKEAALTADKIKAKKPDAVIASYSSVTTEACQPIYQEAGILQLCATSTANRLTQKGYKTFVRTVWNDDAQAKYFASYAKQSYPTKKIWVIHDGSSFPKGWTDSFVAAAKPLNLNVSVEQISPQDKDFTPTLTKLKGAGAEVVVLMTYYAQMGLLTKQGYDLGVKWQWHLCDEFNQEVVKIAGADALQGVLIITSPMPLDLPYPESKSFTDKWKAKYNEDCDYLVWPLAADGFYVLKAAIEGAKTTDPKKVVEYITTKMKNFRGAYGPIDGWDATRECLRGGFMMYTVDKAAKQVVADKSKQLP